MVTRGEEDLNVRREDSEGAIVRMRSNAETEEAGRLAASLPGVERPLGIGCNVSGVSTFTSSGIKRPSSSSDATTSACWFVSLRIRV